MSRKQILASLPIKPKQLTVLKGKGSGSALVGPCIVSSSDAREIARENLGVEKVSVSCSLLANTLVMGDGQPADIELKIPQDSDEAFGIRISNGSILVRGNSAKGLRHGVIALDYLNRRYKGKLPAFELVDYPAMEVRGVMVDPARQVERIEFYEQMVERLAPYRINKFMLYFENKLNFTKHPKLKAPVGYSLSQMKRLAKHCARYGMELVPCFATFGHCEHFLKVKEYRKLADGKRIYQLNPLNRGSKKMLLDMFDDWQSVVPGGGVFHAAADEAPYVGNCAQTAAYIKKHGIESFYANHLNFLHKSLKQRGYSTWIWADMLKHYPKILDMIDKEIVLCEWCYAPVATEQVKALDLFKRKGFKYIVSPAASRSAQHHYPDSMQFDENIPQIIDLGHEKHALGSLCTQWEAYTRANSLTTPGFALSGALSWEGEKSTFARGTQVYKHYYGKDSTAVRKMLMLLSPSIQIQRFGRLHSDSSVKEKTYHVDTHEMIATDPLLYLKYRISPWEKRMARDYTKGCELALELFADKSGDSRMIRFHAKNQLLIAWKRTKINQAGMLFKKAGESYKKGMYGDAAKTLKQSLLPVMQLLDLMADIKKNAKACWSIERYSDDPAFEHLFGRKLSLGVSSLRALVKSVDRTIEAMEQKRDVFPLDRYIASRVVYLYNIGLESKEEINIVTLDVSKSADGNRYASHRRIGAFQKPGSDYLYMAAEGARPINYFKVDVYQTRTAWTPAELSISVLRVASPLGSKPADRPRISTEEYELFADDTIAYDKIHLIDDQAVYQMIKQP